MNKERKSTVACFDFDGTITYCDTLLFFLLSASGAFAVLYHLARKLPLLVSYVIGKASRQKAKEGVLEEFFKGVPIEDVKRRGAKFARTRLKKLVRPEAMERIRWHKAQGHRLILVSASVDVYLIPWAEAAGFDDVVASQVEADENGMTTGKLLGKNCRGKEKVHRLEELLGPLDDYIVYAYGNSDGDKEMLEIADYPFYQTMNSSD